MARKGSWRWWGKYRQQRQAEHEAEKEARRAVSMSEYRRVKAQGGEILPPERSTDGQSVDQRSGEQS